MTNNWYLLIIVFLVFLSVHIYNKNVDCLAGGKRENFTNEQLVVAYDQIYPLDHPRYITPQQKDFQIVLSEHSALDPNMQNRRLDIRTQKCAPGVHCFNTGEWHSLNYLYKSSPNIINTQMGIPKECPNVIYDRHNFYENVIPANVANTEARADQFVNIVVPDLFFKRRVEEIE
jgi:hypothetical protein